MVEDSTMLPRQLDPLDSHSVIVDTPLESSPAADSDREPSSGPGVLVAGLEPNTRIVVATKHSCYRLVVIDAAQKRATVTGGKMFTESTEVRIEGASNGTGVVKSGWIAAGLRLELSIGLRRVTTSPVQSVSIERVPSATPAV